MSLLTSRSTYRGAHKDLGPDFEAQLAAARAGAAKQARSGPLRVLVIEDDPDLRDLLRAALESRGHTVVLAANGQEALELVGEGCPTAIVLDLHMPTMDGRQFLSERPVELAGVPIVVMSASVDRLQLHGLPDVAAVICKPYDTRRLANLLDVVARSA